MMDVLRQWMGRLVGSQGTGARSGEAPKLLPRLDHRFQAPEVASPLGTLMDLSASGARLRSAAQPLLDVGDTQCLGFTTGSQRISVASVVKWIRSPDETETGAWEIGVAFEDQRPGIRGALEELAGAGHITGEHATPRDVGKFQPARIDDTQRPARPDPVAEQLRDIGDAGTASGDGAEVTVEFADLYAMLDVPRDAGSEAIRAAYHEIAKRVHPDRSPEPRDEERFIAANKAYRVLSDAAMRARYDRLLADAERRAA